MNYIDMSGNMLIRIARPSVFVRRQGSDKDPAPPDESARSLRGAKAARVVRALCDYRAKPEQRLAPLRLALAQLNPCYVSKIIGLLERDTLVESARGGDQSNR